MDLELAGDVAVIVGGAQGIGSAIAVTFAEEGANLALVDRDPAVEATARQIAERRDVQALAVVGDVIDYGAMQSAAARVRA